jgi:SAM-dependent methyltransferase
VESPSGPEVTPHPPPVRCSGGDVGPAAEGDPPPGCTPDGRACPRRQWDDDRMTDYVAVNLANWNSRVPHHERGYGLERFRADPDYLSDVVTFDLPRLGRLDGLDVVHLQCHIGSDTLSLARLGARSVTGLDFSPPALAVAAQLAADCSATIEYVESELYDAVDALGPARFDLVYTGVGALCWLPDVRRWAQTVAALLRPGGRLFIREGHPMLWALADERPDGLLVVEYPYFETEGIPFSATTSYVEHEEPLTSPDIVSFNHGLAEIITAVMDAGLTLTAIEEHDSVPWNALGDAMEETVANEFRLREAPARLAASYTLQATKPAQGR